MIAQIRPPQQSQTPSPLARARRMVAETLLPDPSPSPSRGRRWRKWLLFSGAVAAATVAAMIYFCFR